MYSYFYIYILNLRYDYYFVILGLDPSEVGNVTSSVNKEVRVKAKKGFVEEKILDLYMNISKPLQNYIAKKLGFHRNEIIE